MTTALTDALYRQSNGADAPSAAPAASVSPADAYRADALADELKLAALLGWGNLPTLEAALVTVGRCIFATNGGERGTNARLAYQPLPRWRRDWDGAGELIGRCNLEIKVDSHSAYAGIGFGGSFASIVDHPTKDDVIRYAICKAAIAYLTAERARLNERAPA